jgi:tetratricopeptide (TPR) repeat protein
MRRITPQLAIARSILWLLLIACATTARPPAQAQEAAAEVADSEAAGNESANNESVEIAVPLLERPPFDRLTLNGANQNAVIETVIIDFPNRQVPDPFPASGSLDIRRLSHPSIPYQVQWSAIAKVELFEQMLLAEGERLTAEGKFSEAFAYFAFLTSNYPQLPGLEAALQSHLWREASAAYAAGKREEAWPVLVALYQRNPEYPRLVNAVQAVSDDLIGERMKAKDYASARVLVDSLARSFPQLGLTNIARWQNQFQQDAETQLSRARQALAAKDYGEARDAIAYARNIMPTVPGGIELWREIQATAPEIRVGVTAPASAGVMSQTPTWATARVSDLVNPRMVEMVDFGAEGGVYESRWSSVKSSDDGLRTAITLAPEALTRGLRPATLALRLVEMADVAHDSGAIDFATLAAGVNLAQGRDVEIRWRRPHIRPEAFLQIPLRWLASVGEAPGLWFEPLPPARDGPPNDRTNAPVPATPPRRASRVWWWRCNSPTMTPPWRR